MLEKQYQILFNRWCQHKFHGTAVFELKKGETAIRFDTVQEHQENALYNAKHGKVIFKIPDAGFQNPFDSFQMEKVGAYIVLFYSKLYRRKGQEKEFFLIDIDVWLEEKKKSKKRSLGFTRAREIGIARTLRG